MIKKLDCTVKKCVKKYFFSMIEKVYLKLLCTPQFSEYSASGSWWSTFIPFKTGFHTAICFGVLQGTVWL